MLNYLRAQLARLRKDDGQTMIEYALLAFLISVICIIFLAAIGIDIAEWMDAIEDTLGIGNPNVLDATPGISDTASHPDAR